MIGTSCPPFITLLAIRDALIVGLVVEMKNNLIKKTGVFGTDKKIYLVCCGKDRFKNKTCPFTKASLSISHNNQQHLRRLP